jgi:hypothetical protein
LIRPQFIKDRVSDLAIFEKHVQILIGLIPKDGQEVGRFQGHSAMIRSATSLAVTWRPSLPSRRMRMRFGRFIAITWVARI